MRRLIFVMTVILLMGCQTSPHNGARAHPALPAGVTLAGGDGSSFEQAVIIKGANENTGVGTEYKWLAFKYPGYRSGNQYLKQNKGKIYDVFDIITAKGEKKSIYFDITDFYGKL